MEQELLECFQSPRERGNTRQQLRKPYGDVGKDALASTTRPVTREREDRCARPPRHSGREQVPLPVSGEGWGI